MAVVPGNALTLALGKQTAKGTPQATAQAKLRYTGGFGPIPDRATITLAETDSSRQPGDPVVVGLTVQGQSEHYLRPAENVFLTHALLGSTTGSSGTFTSSSTASGVVPYYTLFRAVNVTSEATRMSDVQVSSVTWRGGAGQPLGCTVDWFGLTSLLGSADPATPVPVAESALVYPQVIVTKNGVHDGSVASFEITANQGRSPFVGDSGLSPFDIVPGLYEVTGSLVMLFQSDGDWRNFITGSPSGTVPSTTIGVEALTILAAIDATNSVQWTMTNVFITAYEPQFNTDGSPLLANITFRAKRDSVTLSNVLSVVTKSATAAAP